MPRFMRTSCKARSGSSFVTHLPPHHAAGSTHGLKRRSMKLRHPEIVSAIGEGALVPESIRLLIDVGLRERFCRPLVNMGHFRPKLRMLRICLVQAGAGQIDDLAGIAVAGSVGAGRLQ